MSQFKEIAAWKCAVCGQVLITRQGVERHLRGCCYTSSIIEGQMAFFVDSSELKGTQLTNHEAQAVTES